MFDLTLALADRPGQLLKALEPIAKNGGNIISIIHEREKPTGGYVPVSLVVDFPTDRSFKKALNDLENVDVKVIKSEEVVEKTSVTLILIGKIDVRKILEAKIKDMRITDFEVSAPTSKEACIKMDIEAPTGLINKILEEMKRIADEEKVLLIPSI